MELTGGVRCTREAGVGRIILARPGTGNALDRALLDGLRRGLDALAGDPECRVIVIAAEGPWFCRGLDLAAAADEPPPAQREGFRAYVDCLRLLCDAPRPVVASVEGKVAGGGVGLVAACDLVQATPGTEFQLPEVLLGLIPALVTPFLLRRLSPAAVRHLALGTRGIDAEEARRLGIVDEVVPDAGAALTALLGRLRRSSPVALAETRRYLDAVRGVDLEAQTDAAVERLATWVQRPDVIEGLRTFAAGFAPPWFARKGG